MVLEYLTTSPEASGSVLSGFTFVNDAAKNGEVDPYAVSY